MISPRPARARTLKVAEASAPRTVFHSIEPDAPSRRLLSTRMLRSALISANPTRKARIVDILPLMRGLSADARPDRYQWKPLAPRRGKQRWHPLREEWVVVAAHRQDRPWQGERATVSPSRRRYVESCYFCPRNVRVGGARNPDYQSVFVFDNDHPCVGVDAPRSLEQPAGIYRMHRPPASHASSATRRSTTRRSPSCRLPRLPTSCAPGATSISSSAPAGRPPRADVREQGRGGWSVESAPARPDLRDELRLQDHRN